MSIVPARLSIQAVALSALCLAAAPTAHAQTFRGLGAASGATGPVMATGISPDGSVVFGNSPVDQAGFTWTAANGGTWTTLTSPFPVGQLVGSNTDGSVIIGTDYHSTLADSRAAHWGDNLFDEFFSLPNRPRSRATGVSADGSVIVGTCVGFNNAFPAPAVWSDPFTVTDLGGYDPNNAQTAAALGVSADGLVPVGIVTTSQIPSAVRWTAIGQAEFLDSTSDSEATRANADGSVVAGQVFVTDHDEAFRWTAQSGMVPLGVLPGGFDSDPAAISADGAVVVGNCDGDTPAPFIWTSGHMQSLAEYLSAQGIVLTGWTLDSVTGMSADGTTLVGNGSFNGDQQPWLATIVRAPACGSADFNGDGDVGTDTDIEAFFACLAGSCCRSCGSPDFNADGDVGTDADLEAFFRVLGGGNC